LIRRAETIVELEKLARSQFDSLWQTYKAEIKNQPDAVRSRFHALTEASGKPTQIDWELPEQIVERKRGAGWTSHLYCDEAGDFYTELNGWEKSLMEQLMKEKGFLGWLRNLPRRDWALVSLTRWLAQSPSIRILSFSVRRDGKSRSTCSSRTTIAVLILGQKPKGLAVFADSHGLEFGRLVIARKKGDEFQFVDMNDRVTREKARKMQSPNDMESLFG
jgi:type III restriction enzyme